jgi:hypothetical protein
MVNADDVMKTVLEMAKKHGADMNPKDGIIKFVIPKEDMDNPTDRNVMIEINVIKKMTRMTEVKN